MKDKLKRLTQRIHGWMHEIVPYCELVIAAEIMYQVMVYLHHLVRHTV